VKHPPIQVRKSGAPRRVSQACLRSAGTTKRDVLAAIARH